MAAKGNLVGIDLGTTMSVIARLDPGGQAVTIPNSAGDPLTPSVVYLDGKRALVGRMAKEAAAIDPARVATAVKREIGRPQYSRLVDGRAFRPETLSAIILRKLKQDAERRIGPIARAVITVPAFFDDARRKATEDAGRIAGLEVLDIINEPSAAALSYAMQAGRAGGGTSHLVDIPGGVMTAVVYDLGGGTFDCTAVRLQSRRFETLATDGEVELGGKDFDERIVAHVATEFQRQFGVDPRQDRHEALAALAEKAKILLSTLPSVPIEFSFRGHTLELMLSRAQFEALSADLLTRTRVVTELVVGKQAGLRFDQVDRYLLVGGSTHMPMVRQMLTELTGKPPDDGLDVDQVVAQGAAIHAGIVAAKSAGDLEIDDRLRRQLEDVTELNVNAHSLGIVAIRDGLAISTRLIPKNSQLPRASSEVFRLRFPGAREIEVRVVEGEADEAAHNIPVGQCAITGLPPGLPRGAPVQVRLSYGANGLVQVMALDMTSGRFAEATIVRQNRLSDAEVRREAALVDSLSIE